jgi:hypothetical protein
MSDSMIIDTWKFDGKCYKIILTQARPDVCESYQLNEELILKRDENEYFEIPDEPFVKIIPLVIAFKNPENKISISMQHEGLAIEPLLRFLSIITKKWKNESNYSM